MNSTKQQDDDRYEFRGVKLAHELMVDIWGALIPGALFLFCFICMLSPILYYFGPNLHSIRTDFNTFWIVAFLSFLILSYVLGMIFYRADIKQPDRADIRREQESKLLMFLKDMPKGYVPKEHKSYRRERRHNVYNNPQSKSLNMKWWQKLRLFIQQTLITPNRIKSLEKKRIYHKLCNARTKYSVKLLLREVSPLKRAMKSALTNNRLPVELYNNHFFDCCCKTEEYLQNLLSNKSSRIDAKNLNEFRKNILCILFPDDIDSIISYSDKNKDEDYKEIKNGSRHKYYIISRTLFPEISILSLSARDVIMNTVKVVPLVHSFRGHIRWGLGRLYRIKARLFRINHDWYLERRRVDTSAKYEPYNMYMIAYLILHMQNESGCATEKRCDFPYISYYKYLLKREQIDILEYDQWSAYTKRTKNCINQYKIELQLHEPKAYSIIIKNESHIRMASSSWHVAKVIRNISWVPFIILLYTHKYLALLFPICTICLSLYILHRIPQFIHYQRLREIYYTLCTYKSWRDAKDTHSSTNAI